MSKFTDEQLKTWAREYVTEAACNLDFTGVGEHFDEDWEPFNLSFDEYQDLMRKVHDLAGGATVTVSWPGEQAGPMPAERLAEILWTGRKRALGDSDDDQPFAGVSARIRTQYERFATEVAKQLGKAGDVTTPDPRARALELLADRYAQAFEWLLADEQAKATRADGPEASG